MGVLLVVWLTLCLVLCGVFFVVLCVDGWFGAVGFLACLLVVMFIALADCFSWFGMIDCGLGLVVCLCFPVCLVVWSLLGVCLGLVCRWFGV